MECQHPEDDRIEAQHRDVTPWGRYKTWVCGLCGFVGQTFEPVVDDFTRTVARLAPGTLGIYGRIIDRAAWFKLREAHGLPEKEGGDLWGGA